MYIIKNLSVLLADDHSVVRKGMSMLLEEFIEFPKIYNSSTIVDTFRMLKIEKIDILILDINFPEGNSASIVTEVKKSNPEIKILIFSALEEDVYALRYLNAGANGFLNKLSSESDMKDALKIFLETGIYITANINEKILDKYIYQKSLNPLDQLSEREMEVAILLIKGYGNLEISLAKRIQPTTVSTYKKRIFEKLEIDNLVALIELFNSYNNDF